MYSLGSLINILAVRYYIAVGYSKVIIDAGLKKTVDCIAVFVSAVLHGAHQMEWLRQNLPQLHQTFCSEAPEGG